MTNAEAALTGLQYLCVCTSAPLIIGILVGYSLRGRVDRVGWRWALLPNFMRRAYISIVEAMNEADDTSSDDPSI